MCRRNSTRKRLRVAVPSTTLPDKEKITKYLDAVTAKAGDLNPKLASCMQIAQPFIVLPIQIAGCLAPFYLWAYKWCCKIC